MPGNFLERNRNRELACLAVRGLVRTEGNTVPCPNKAMIKISGFASVYISLYPQELLRKVSSKITWKNLPLKITAYIFLPPFY